MIELIDILYKVGNNVSDSLHNGAGGYSLRKLLAVVLTLSEMIILFKYTDHDNIEAVLVIVAGQIMALVGLYTWGNIKHKEVENGNRD